MGRLLRLGVRDASDPGGERKAVRRREPIAEKLEIARSGIRERDSPPDGDGQFPFIEQFRSDHPVVVAQR